MSSKKLTDIDILRVLNCCYDKDEIILSFYENNELKVDLTVQDIIDFINHLCETIEKGDYTSYTAQVAKQSWHTQNSEYIEKLEAENERLKRLLAEEEAKYSVCAKQFYKEGAKDFSERLKEELSANTDNNGDINSCIVPIVVDNLLKGMGFK